ncbi:MAG: hypothetical protein JKX81_17060, partial [Arenicella sp.]|nr:hypothetical protein [Arenicella sp.]
PGAPNPGTPNPGTPNPGTPNPGTPNTQTIAASLPSNAMTTINDGQLQVSTEPPVGVRLAFSLRKVNQQEDKFAVLEYDRADAVQRVYGAQGLIGILASDLDDAHFLKVDLDSTFFRSLDISAEAPDNIFDSLGLSAVDVAIDYGDEDDEDHIKHKDFRFQANGEKKGEVSFFLNRSLDLHYSLSTQYHFDPLSGWEGEKISYEMPTRPTMDRTLMVNPFNDLGFMRIQIAAAEMDEAMMDSTDVHMVYDDGDWRVEKVFKVSPNGEDQVWKLRLSKPEIREFSYHFVHHLANGDTITTEAKRQVASLVAVNDPFEDPLVIEFFPNYDGANIQQLFIDIRYEDQANDYQRKERVMFSGDESGSKTLRFARMNTELGEFSYKVTILGTDNSVRRIPEVTTDESLVFLGSLVGQG